MKTNNELVDHLVASGVLKTPEIAEAFRAVDRADFVTPEYLDRAYGDYPLPIGHGQTISQPYTVAFMIELLDPKEGNKVLDIGSGSGWTAALLATIVGRKGSMKGVEAIPELVTFGRQNLKKYLVKNATIDLAGKELGLPEEAPFDRILVSAAGTVLPRDLVKQLKVGEIMVIPIGSSVWKVEKFSEKDIRRTEYPSFAFVPLVE